MFCTECGTKLDDDCLFCPNCGTKVAGAAEGSGAAEANAPAEPKQAEEVKETQPAQEAQAPVAEEKAPAAEEKAPAAAAQAPAQASDAQPPKKSKKGLIIGICCAVLAVAVIGGGIFILKDRLGNNEEESSEARKRDRDDDDDDKDTKESSIASGEETSEEQTSAVASTEVVAPTDGGATEASSEESLSREEIISGYHEWLSTARTWIEMGEPYEAKYTGVDETYGPAASFDRSVNAIVNDFELDLDGDGDDELLVIRVKDGSLEYAAYEVTTGTMLEKATWNQSRKDEGVALLDKSDQFDLSVYLYEYDGKYYVIERFYTGRNWGPGYLGSYLGILTYNGEAWETILSEYRTGTEEVSFQAGENIKEALANVGLAETAEEYTYVGNYLSEMDGAEEVLYVYSGRTEENIAHDEAVYDDEAKNVSDLYGVKFYFYDNVDQYDDMAYNGTVQIDDNPYVTSFDYTRNVRTIETTDELGGIVNYCDHVIFHGEDEELMAWLNEQVEEAIYAYDNEEVVDTLYAAYEEKAESPYPEEEYYFQPLDLNSVYVEDNYVSVGFTWEWFMGGVYNSGAIGRNYDLSEKRALTLKEVLGKEDDEVFELVLQKVTEDYGTAGSDMFRESLKKYLEQYGDYPFWFDGYYVYICFESYSLDQGSMSIRVWIER